MTTFDKAAFYKSARSTLLGPSLDDGEVSGCEAILTAMAGTPISHCAYALATAYKETARKLVPVIEAFWLSEAWRKAHLRYWPWYGRGLVQITWEFNYRKADAALAAAGLIKPGELLADPSLALRVDNAAFIMRVGMEEGWFSSGHSLPVHLPRRIATVEEYESARRIINGTDCKHEIAVYAMQFQDALAGAGW